MSLKCRVRRAKEDVVMNDGKKLGRGSKCEARQERCESDIEGGQYSVERAGVMGVESERSKQALHS